MPTRSVESTMQHYIAMVQREKNLFTLVELSFSNNITYGILSILKTFNFPLTIIAHLGKGNWSKVACRGDVFNTCPHIMQVKNEVDKLIACKTTY